MNRDKPILVTGASGFVGRHLTPVLNHEGYFTRLASRRPVAEPNPSPTQKWVPFDIENEPTVIRALSGCDTAFYLLHAMSMAGDFEQRESAWAQRFARIAAQCGVRRIIYLGGIEPCGAPSKHLRSRLKTGDILHSSGVPTVELRAGMIVGVGSESWNIVRDLAVRLPAMVLPKWLRNSSEPVAIEDVVTAMRHALQLPDDLAGCYDLPGPEVLSGREVLMRIAKINGTRPVMIDVPVITPRLSSYWIRLVTRADYTIARQLVEGLVHDLISQGPSYWPLIDGFQLTPFDEAARRTLKQEARQMPRATQRYEAMLRLFALKYYPSSPSNKRE